MGSDSDIRRGRLPRPVLGVKRTERVEKRTLGHEGLLSGQQRKSAGTPLNSHPTTGVRVATRGVG